MQQHYNSANLLASKNVNKTQNIKGCSAICRQEYFTLAFIDGCGEAAILQGASLDIRDTRLGKDLSSGSDGTVFHYNSFPNSSSKISKFSLWLNLYQFSSRRYFKFSIRHICPFRLISSLVAGIRISFRLTLNS